VYVQIGKSASANHIDFRMYLYWNNTTHTGVVEIGTYTNTYIDSDDDDYFYLWVYGCKDWVAVVIKLGSTYYGSMVTKYTLPYSSPVILQSNSGTGTDKVFQGERLLLFV